MSAIQTTVRPENLQSEISRARRASALAALNQRVTEADASRGMTGDTPHDPAGEPARNKPRERREQSYADAKARYARLDRLGKIKSRLMAADPRCYFCGRPLRKRSFATLDHLNPLSKGGTDDPTNLILACLPCNESKADRTPEEWAASILNAIASRLADPAIPPVEIVPAEITPEEQAEPEDGLRNIPRPEACEDLATAQAERLNPMDLHRLERAREREALDRMTPEERRQYADGWAVREFERDPFSLDTAENRADAVSLAWEIVQQARPIPWHLAMHFAWRLVRTGRNRLFPESAFSVTSPRRDRNVAGHHVRHRRTTARRLLRMKDARHPAVEVPLRIDVESWLSTISATRRTIAVMLAQGYTIREIAPAVDLHANYVGKLIPLMAASLSHFFSLTEGESVRNENPLRTLTDRFVRQEASLPPRQRESLRMLLIEARDIEDAAARLGCGGRAVSGNAHLALDKIGARPEERRALMAKPNVRRRLLRQLAACTPADASAIAAELDIGRADA